MNGGELLEYYLCTNNSTPLQRIRPQLSGSAVEVILGVRSVCGNSFTGNLRPQLTIRATAVRRISTRIWMWRGQAEALVNWGTKEASRFPHNGVKSQSGEKHGVSFYGEKGYASSLDLDIIK
ncbi:hypothetical protein BGAL_0623g00010 [Botrytis galanthina]|uniref:Uncharacterized protein n=1 Tax=Botrytis galanthina TaxID=278940 RepID=A0A4S8QSU4_9HELO|nr:hypothetical protein BGAL_0623g00010 [Botrytis galanthina]